MEAIKLHFRAFSQNNNYMTTLLDQLVIFLQMVMKETKPN